MQQQHITEREAYQAVRGVKTDEHVLPLMEPQASANTAADRAALLEQMNSFSRTTRERAVREASTLPPDQLLTLIQTGANFYRMRKWRSTCIELVLILGWLPGGIWLFIVSNLSTTAIMMSFWPLLIGVVSWHLLYVPFRLSRSLAASLEKTDDVKLLGPAISLYVNPEDYREMHRELGNTLCRLLPRLRADQSGLLTREQKRDLLSLVAAIEPTEIRVKGLKALEQVGDESAYQIVNNILRLSPDKEVQKAAAECLEYLKQHANERREMQTLLRASDPSEASAPDVLLRPAEGQAHTPAEQLLRSS